MSTLTQLRRSPFWISAVEQWTLAVRSRQVAIFAGVFAALAMAVAASGYVLTGGTGLQDFARTSASLVELVLLLVPLAALMVGATAFTPDRGAAELRYSQPVSRRTLLAGQLTGLFLALVAAETIGFGAAGVVLFWRTGAAGAGGFLGVMTAGAALTAVFLSLAAAIAGGATSRGRARVLAVALVLWLAAVALVDVAALGASSWLTSGAASRLLMVTAIFNPVGAVRTGVMMALDGTAAFGAASLAFLRFTGGTAGAYGWLVASVVLWTGLGYVIGAKRLERADL
jgi:Cu-processing system permease protein